MHQSLPPYYPHRSIKTIDGLARFLSIPTKKLHWLIENRNKLYKVKLVPKKDKTTRTTCAPSYGLKAIQREINRKILKRIVFPDYLHGSVPKRTPLSNAYAHRDAHTLVNLDVSKFFDFIRDDLVFNVFRKLLGFPPEVAEVLVRLTTRNGVTPQGSPTSSYLAQLVFFEVEPGLVRQLRKEGFRYTRYVDDISVSSTMSLSGQRIGSVIGRVRSMCGKLGFRLKDKKELICRPHGRKRTADGVKSESSQKRVPHMEITGLRLKTGREPICIPKSYRRSIASDVRALQRNEASDPRSRPMRNSLTGKCAHVARLHPAFAKKIRAQLDAMA